VAAGVVVVFVVRHRLEAVVTLSSWLGPSGQSPRRSTTPAAVRRKVVVGKRWNYDQQRLAVLICCPEFSEIPEHVVTYLVKTFPLNFEVEILYKLLNVSPNIALFSRP
jgi:hypothetical protein